jgi:putative membrane protein
MFTDALWASAHHLAAFTLAAMLAVEAGLLLAGQPLTRERLRLLSLADGLYGASAAAVLVVGLLRAVFGAKGWDFYAGNPLFWIKLGLFVVIGLVSIVPTVRIIRWRRAAELPSAAAQAATLKLVLLQGALLLTLPLLAAFMARGFGH